MNNDNYIPDDFNWKIYLKINTDLPRTYNENECIRHYLIHGKNEKRLYKKNLTYYLPEDFNWKTYSKINSDLPANYTKKDYIVHYITHGRKENRHYKMTIDILKNLDLFYYDKTNSEIEQIESDLSENEDLIYDSSVTFADKNYDYYECLHSDSILCSKLFYKSDDKFLQYKIDNQILNSLKNFILIVDFQNGGGGTTFFLNTIVSKYKYNQTFLIARNFYGLLHLNINEEYELNDKYNNDDSLLLLDKYKDKISKIFINHRLGHSDNFINKLFDLNKEVITITHDYSILTKICQPYYHKIKKCIAESPSDFDPKKYSMIISQNETNINVFGDNIHSIVELPDFKKSDKLIINNNRETIVIGIIGNIIDIKGRKIFRKIIKIFKENSNLEFVVIGNVIINNFTNYHCYNNINEFNDILIKTKPHALLELSLWPETYSYTLSLSMLTQLPIFCLKKKFNSVVENRLNQYNKAYYFSTLDELKYLIKNKMQQFFCTINPNIYYNKFWNELFITKTKICNKQNFTYKHNVKPYFIYFPQFHVIEENNQNFYKNFTDIINLKEYNLVSDDKLEEPLLRYLNIEKIEDYNLENSNIIQKQIEIIDHYNFEGLALYYYWFSQNTITKQNMIMKKVIDNFFNNTVDLKSKKVFFIWANEDWTNNAAFGEKDKDKEFIIRNLYNESNFYENSKNLLQYFNHNNYLKIDNKPVFFIYHNHLIHDNELNVFYNILNTMCIENNFSGVHLILNSFMKQSTNFKNFYINFNYKKYESRFYEDKTKQIYLNYKEYISNPFHLNKNTIQTICLDFNNKPRLFKPNQLDKSTVCINNTEFDKITFINKLLEMYNYNKSSDVENILLINSFNEWGENMAFEPGNKYEYYNLNLLLECLQCSY
jgi:hypothetical protein